MSLSSITDALNKAFNSPKRDAANEFALQTKAGRPEADRSTAGSDAASASKGDLVAQSNAPRTYEGRLYGGTVTATPYGPADSNGQVRYRVRAETGDGLTAEIDVLLTGQFGPEQLRSDSPTKRQLDQALAAQQAERRSESSAPRTYEGRLYGGTVTATPYGPADSNGQVRYRVRAETGDGLTAEIDVLLTGQFGPEQLRSDSPTKRQLDQALAAQQAERRSESSAPRTYEGRLYGGTVTATPYGPADSNGQVRYRVRAETGDGLTAEIDVLLTGQFGPEQLRSDSPTKRQLDQALAAQQAERRSESSAPRTYEGRLYGGTVTATPMGPPGSNGQTLYEVTLRTGGHTIKVEAYLTGQFGPDQLRPDSPIKRQLDQALAAQQAERANEANPSRASSDDSKPRTYVDGNGEEIIELVVTATRDERPTLALEDLANIDPVTGERAPEPVKRFLSEQEPGPNSQVLRPADPNSEPSPQHVPGPGERALRGALGTVASGPANLLTLLGMGANQLTGNPGIQNAGEVWRQRVEDFYFGGPDQPVANIRDSEEFNKGREFADVAGFALDIITGVGGVASNLDNVADAARITGAVDPVQAGRVIDSSPTVVSNDLDSFSVRPNSTSAGSRPAVTSANPDVLPNAGYAGDNSGIRLGGDSSQPALSSAPERPALPPAGGTSANTPPNVAGDAPITSGQQSSGGNRLTLQDPVEGAQLTLPEAPTLYPVDNPRTPLVGGITVRSNQALPIDAIPTETLDEAAAFISARNPQSYRTPADARLALEKADQLYIIRDDAGAIQGTATLSRRGNNEWYLGQVAGARGTGDDVMKRILGDFRQMAMNSGEEVTISAYTNKPQNVYKPDGSPGFYDQLGFEIRDSSPLGPQDMTTERRIDIVMQMNPDGTTGSTGPGTPPSGGGGGVTPGGSGGPTGLGGDAPIVPDAQSSGGNRLTLQDPVEGAQLTLPEAPTLYPVDNPRTPLVGGITVRSNQALPIDAIPTETLDEAAAFISARNPQSYRTPADARLALDKADQLYIIRDDAGAIQGTATLSRRGNNEWYLGQVAGARGTGDDVMKRILGDFRQMAMNSGEEVTISAYTNKPQNVYKPDGSPGFYDQLGFEIRDSSPLGPQDMTTERRIDIVMQMNPDGTTGSGGPATPPSGGGGGITPGGPTGSGGDTPIVPGQQSSGSSGATMTAPAIPDSPGARQRTVDEVAELGVQPPDLTPSSTPLATRVADGGPITPEFRDGLTQRAANYVSGRVPENVEDAVAKQVAADALDFVGRARTPEEAEELSNTFFGNLARQRQTIGLMGDQADRARRAANDTAITNFVRERWPSEDRPNVVAVLRGDFRNASVDDVNQALADMSDNKLFLVSGHAGVAPPESITNPPQTGGIDNINLLRGRFEQTVNNPPLGRQTGPVPDSVGGQVGPAGVEGSVRTANFETGQAFQPPGVAVLEDVGTGFDSAGMLLEEAVKHPLQFVSSVGQFERRIIPNGVQAVRNAAGDAVRNMVEPEVLNVASGAQRIVEGTAYGFAQGFNVVANTAQAASGLAPKPVRDAATLAATTAAEAAKLTANIWNSVPLDAARTAAGNALLGYTLTQAPNLDLTYGVVGEEGSNVEGIAANQFLRDGTHVLAFQTAEDAEGDKVALGTSVFFGNDYRKGSNRFQFGPSGVSQMSSEFLRPVAQSNTFFSYRAEDNIPRGFVWTHAAQFPGAGLNPFPMISTAPQAAGQDGSAIQVGSQASAGGYGSVQFSGIVEGPAMLLERGATAQGLIAGHTTAGAKIGSVDAFAFAIAGNPAYLSNDPNALEGIRKYVNGLPGVARMMHDAAADALIPNNDPDNPVGWHWLKDNLDQPVPGSDAAAGAAPAAGQGAEPEVRPNP